MLQGGARLISRAFGRQSRLIQALRPNYECFLDRIYGGAGVPWEINGNTFRIDPHQRHRLAHDYDCSVAQFFESRVHKGQVCFDIGANVGVYVLQMANWTAPAGRVVAFEPNPAARTILQNHVRMNGLLDRIYIVPAAVGGNAGSATLYAAEADGMSRLNSPNASIAAHARPVDVETVTLDDYVMKTGTTPDVLMLDIEGFEIEALAGARRLIQEKRDLLIVVEMHPDVWTCAGSSRQSAEQLLDELELVPVPLQGQSDPLEDHAIVHLQQRERSAG